MDKKDLEQTLVLIKPDALKNSLTGYILSVLSEFHTGLHYCGTKIVHVGRMLAEEHYAEHRGKVFFPAILEYLMGESHYPDNPMKRRVIAIVYQGRDAIKKIREVVGPTNPLNARVEKPGSIRSLGTMVPLKDDDGNVIGQRMDNLIHASDTPQSAEREIKLWFRPDDMPPLMHTYPTEASGEFYYFRDNRLFREYEKGSVCILAPADVAWKSDLEILHNISRGLPAAGSLQSVVAKYLINSATE
ncbi:MAG TPA: nucleoside-diphosphate kinase [Bacteroidales bacterium]|jgi:nucleoside-diphosphate kinase|nr:nucleoside-diphosphate kinase [Bacteroidales bacterium]HOS72826.1 nucleoside-diphosphate kinase [Bacteroidales bacterium]HQH23330.1 nucleoside-diphosphate kinase [Bacteroidales bacterium]HQJ83087.1 nucleoside-diphosphate kinase [Bacteroidales bacterium]